MSDLPSYLDPAKNFTPRQNPPKQESQAIDKSEIAKTEAAKLDGMTREELLALIKRCAGYSWGIGMMTKAEIAEAMMHQLAVKALEPAGRETLAAIREWLDREKGKAVTPVAAQIQIRDDRPVDKRELARKIAFLLAAGQAEGENGVLLGPIENTESV